MAKLSCGNHLDRDAGFRCPQCGYLCPDCTDHRWTGGGFVDQCKACDALIEPLSSTAGPDRGPMEYFGRIPHFVRFPVSRPVLVLLFGLAVLVTVVSWMLSFGAGVLIIGLVAAIGLAGLEVATYFHMVSSTASGKEDIDAPEWSDLLDDIIAPVLRYVAALLPIAAGILWFGYSHSSWTEAFEIAGRKPLTILNHTGPAVLIIAGLILLPLLTIIAAMSQSAAAVLDPRNWWQSLRIMGTTYAAGAAAFYAVGAIEVFVWIPLLGKLSAAYPIPLVTALATTFLAYLPMALRARLLGGLAEPFADELS